MPSVCKVYELEGAKDLPTVLEALKEGEAPASVELRLLETSGVRARGVVKLAEAGRSVSFEIFGFKGRLFLLVAAGKRIARRIAGTISKLARVEPLEVKVPPQRLRALYEEGVVKLVVFDMVRVPGLRKIVLTGDAVSDTEIFRDLSRTCEVRYVVFEDKSGLLLGVSESLTVVSLSKMPEEELMELVKEKFLPLAVG